MRWGIAAGAVALVAFPVLLVSVVLGLLAGSAPARPVAPDGGASDHALADIPTAYLRWYTHWAAECPGLPWSVVAAIGKIETDHGRSTLPGVHAGANTHGAAGPMQIGTGGRAGDTWSAYGRDGDVPPDGTEDVYHPPDAIRGAVAYLCDHGAGAAERLRGAVFAYNRSRAYVDQVLTLAARYRAPEAAGSGDASALLANPRVTLTPNARADLEAGIIDPRLITLLTALAQRHPIAISVLKTGHSPYVAGTRTYSQHYFGRAADIYEIAGQPVSPGNPAAREATAWLASLSGPLRPGEVGSPFPEFEHEPGHFHDRAHLDHLHLAAAH